MSELKLRLQNASSACIEAYEAWRNDMKDDAAREKLMDTVHELRKVSSRLEIEIALNDRKNTNAKRIPIPEHKSKMDNRKGQKPLSEILPVAELKEARRKKLELQAAEHDNDDNDDDHDIDNEDIIDLTVSDDHQGDDNVAPKSEKPKSQRQRAPRRKRPEGGDENNGNGNSNES